VSLLCPRSPFSDFIFPNPTGDHVTLTDMSELIRILVTWACDKLSTSAGTKGSLVASSKGSCLPISSGGIGGYDRLVWIHLGAMNIFRTMP